jgi:hypothetical protein
MKLLERVDHVGRRMHLSRNTVRCYQRWVREYLVFSRREMTWREPAEQIHVIKLPTVAD